MRRLLAAAVLLAACSRQPELPPGAALYRARDGAFSLAAPESWRVVENQGGSHRVSLYGPGAQSIAVFRHDSGDPRAYAASQSLNARAAAPEETVVEGRKALRLTVERSLPPLHGRGPLRLVETLVILPDEKGFWVLVHGAAAGAAADDEAFELALKTFKPAGA